MHQAQCTPGFWYSGSVCKEKGENSRCLIDAYCWNAWDWSQALLDENGINKIKWVLYAWEELLKLWDGNGLVRTHWLFPENSAQTFWRGFIAGSPSLTSLLPPFPTRQHQHSGLLAKYSLPCCEACTLGDSPLRRRDEQVSHSPL
jgi:hypothetical protein